MGGSSGSGSSQKTEPWVGQQEPLKKLYERGENVYQATPKTAYAGETFQDKGKLGTDVEGAAFGQGQRLQGAGDTLLAGATNMVPQLGQTTDASKYKAESFKPFYEPTPMYSAGSYTPTQYAQGPLTKFQLNPLENPFFMPALNASQTQTLNNLTRATMPQLTSNAIMSGAYDNDRYWLGMGQLASDAYKQMSDQAAMQASDLYKFERSGLAAQENLGEQLNTQRYGVAENAATSRYNATEQLRANQMNDFMNQYMKGQQEYAQAQNDAALLAQKLASGENQQKLSMVPQLAQVGGTTQQLGQQNLWDTANYEQQQGQAKLNSQAQRYQAGVDAPWEALQRYQTAIEPGMGFGTTTGRPGGGGLSGGIMGGLGGAGMGAALAMATGMPAMWPALIGGGLGLASGFLR